MSNIKLFYVFAIGLFHLSQLSHACPGCPEEKDVNDPAVVKFLTTTLSQYGSIPVGTEHEKAELVKINKVTSQVVSGIRYVYNFDARGVQTHNLYQCQLRVLSRPWAEGTTVLDFTCKPLSNDRSKRSIPGGEFEIDVDSTHLHGLKQFIEQQLNERKKPVMFLGIVKFLHATQQVVSGIVTRALIEVAGTNCPPGSTSELCVFQKENHQACKIEVWEQPWLQKKELSLMECNQIPTFCAGCPTDISPEDKEANMCLKRALYNLNTKGHSKQQFSLRKITKLQSQVVAGLKYTVEFEAEDQAKAIYSCKAVIVSQPWISSEPIVDNFDCLPENSG